MVLISFDVLPACQPNVMLIIGVYDSKYETSARAHSHITCSCHMIPSEILQVSGHHDLLNTRFRNQIQFWAAVPSKWVLKSCLSISWKMLRAVWMSLSGMHAAMLLV